jgi:hypothetical protein
MMLAAFFRSTNRGGYKLLRDENCVIIFTVPPNTQTKQNMAAVSSGQWPRWNDIVKAVPEMADSSLFFDARATWEWVWRWKVEAEMSRQREVWSIRREHHG